MSEPLPVQLDAATLADRGRSLSGELPVTAFRRLGQWLRTTEGRLAFELVFDRDDHGRRRLRARVRGSLDLQCERCLAGYALPLEHDFALVLIDSEAEADTLPEEIDAVVLPGTRSMHTVDLLEDELILALPLVPRCETVRPCRPAAELLDSGEVLGGDTGPRQQPFGDLAGRFDGDPDEQ